MTLHWQLHHRVLTY